MRNHHSGGFGFGSGEFPPRRETELNKPKPQSDAAGTNSPEQVLWEVGLVLVVALGVALAANLALVALHIS